jgi:hypothetical protein
VFPIPIQALCFFLGIPWEITLDVTNSVALVRERTIPTERPPLVGEVSTNFYG